MPYPMPHQMPYRDFSMSNEQLPMSTARLRQECALRIYTQSLKNLPDGPMDEDTLKSVSEAAWLLADAFVSNVPREDFQREAEPPAEGGD